MADFGVRPKIGRVFVRVQEMDADGKIVKTQSMSVWGQTFDDVLANIEAQLRHAYGDGEAKKETAGASIKAKVGGRRKA